GGAGRRRRLGVHAGGLQPDPGAGDPAQLGQGPGRGAEGALLLNAAADPAACSYTRSSRRVAASTCPTRSRNRMSRPIAHFMSFRRSAEVLSTFEVPKQPQSTGRLRMRLIESAITKTTRSTPGSRAQV